MRIRSGQCSACPRSGNPRVKEPRPVADTQAGPRVPCRAGEKPQEIERIATAGERAGLPEHQIPQEHAHRFDFLAAVAVHDEERQLRRMAMARTCTAADLHSNSADGQYRRLSRRSLRRL